ARRERRAVLELHLRAQVERQRLRVVGELPRRREAGDDVQVRVELDERPVDEAEGLDRLEGGRLLRVERVDVARSANDERSATRGRRARRGAAGERGRRDERQ